MVTAKPGHCAFFAGRSVFLRIIWRQDRFRATIATSVDLELSRFVMTSERISSRAVNHWLDEPRQIILQHGCVPGAPASVALFFIRSPVILTKEHSLHFRLRQDTAC